MQNTPMTVAEIPTLAHDAKALLTEDERNALILFLAEHPEAGAIIEQTGESKRCAGRAKEAAKAAGIMRAALAG